jgi:rod shape determining protein RodA
VTPTYRTQTATSSPLGWANAIRQVDPVLLVAAVGLSLFGLLMIYSATAPRLESAATDPMHFVNRQALSLGIGLVAMAVVVLFDYRQFRAWAPVLYGLSIVLLVLTVATGETVKASRSWIVFGGFQFQPAELAKPALILMLAALFHERREEALGRRLDRLVRRLLKSDDKLAREVTLLMRLVEQH